MDPVRAVVSEPTRPTRRRRGAAASGGLAWLLASLSSACGEPLSPYEMSLRPQFRGEASGAVSGPLAGASIWAYTPPDEEMPRIIDLEAIDAAEHRHHLLLQLSGQRGMALPATLPVRSWSDPLAGFEPTLNATYFPPSADTLNFEQRALFADSGNVTLIELTRARAVGWVSVRFSGLSGSTDTLRLRGVFVARRNR